MNWEEDSTGNAELGVSYGLINTFEDFYIFHIGNVQNVSFMQ